MRKTAATPSTSNALVEPAPTAGLVAHSLLDEPLLGVEDGAGRRERLTLPGLLARLSRGEPTELTALQAHQQHAWHAFTVQLAAIALVRAERETPPIAEHDWRKLLVAAAARDGGGPEAFALVVDDLAKPAFMQPPVPEGSLDALKNSHRVPSAELDVLVTSKNHDVKIEAIHDPSPEHWALALVGLQTMQGFLGAGNYGIARMNGGFSSRPCVAFASDLGSASRFVRDVGALLSARPPLLSRGFGRKATLGLVWCAPWDGRHSLAMDTLDPFFIEVCRRIRLAMSSTGAIVARRGSSTSGRLDGGDAAGNTGDPWTPVSRADGKALTMPEAGFTYDRVQDQLFGDWAHGAAGELAAGDKYWLGQVLARGQGKTGGYHERWLPMPARVSRLFAKQDSRSALAARAKAWVEKAATVRLKILKPALLTLLQGGPEKLKFDDDRAQSFLARLDSAIDERFFPLLFETAETSAETADTAFETALVELAKQQFERAVTSMPTPTARRPRAIARAEAVFWGSARKHFTLAFGPERARADTAQGDGQ